MRLTLIYLFVNVNVNVYVIGHSPSGLLPIRPRFHATSGNGLNLCIDIELSQIRLHRPQSTLALPLNFSESKISDTRFS